MREGGSESERARGRKRESETQKARNTEQPTDIAKCRDDKIVMCASERERSTLTDAVCTNHEVKHKALSIFKMRFHRVAAPSSAFRTPSNSAPFAQPRQPIPPVHCVWGNASTRNPHVSAWLPGGLGAVLGLVSSYTHTHTQYII